MASIIQIRRDTAANWTSANPTLAQGEIGFEIDTLKLKVGDGSTAWTSLSYYAGGQDHGNLTGLADDDHTQYHTDARGDARYSLLSHNHTGVYEPADATILKDADIGVTVQAYDADLTTWAGKTAPSGTVVGDTDTQTLTNKTVSGLVINDGYTEEVYAVTGTTPALSPTNGTIQTWTLTGNSTPTAGTWAAGQNITLMIDDGTDYTITWTSLAVTWKTDSGSAPTLNTSGYTAIALWKVGTTIYGARVGDA